MFLIWMEKRVCTKFKEHPRDLANCLASLDETVNKRKASLRSNDKNELKKQKSGGEVDINTLVSNCYTAFHSVKILCLF